MNVSIALGQQGGPGAPDGMYDLVLLEMTFDCRKDFDFGW